MHLQVQVSDTTKDSMEPMPATKKQITLNNAALKERRSKAIISKLFMDCLYQ
jgi:hypothetical protein